MPGQYSADPAALRNALKEIQYISDWVARAAADFEAGQGRTVGWWGEDDSFAKQQGPQAMKEMKGTVETAQALSSAVGGVVRGVGANIRNIVGTQEQNLEDIGNSRNRQQRGGRH